MEKKILILFFYFFQLSLLSAQKQTILINNVEIFNGKDQNIFKGNILIVDNLISKISSATIPITEGSGVTVIDAKGKFLMPGLIDAHYHTMMDSMPIAQLMMVDISFLNLFAAKASEKQLMRGFTSVRDMGGASFNLKKAIDMGLASGPRIYPSGATISQTGGHGDFGLPTDVPRVDGELSYFERTGMTIIADGSDAVLKRTREQLRQGASQIKLMAGGGVASNYDPIDVAQYSEDEFKAAVEAASNWGTYVSVHAYTPKAITTAIKGGVTCIEHGQMLDEKTVQLMAEKGIWLCLQPFLDDEDANPNPEGSENRKKQLIMVSGTDTAYKLAKKYNVKLAFGTDCLFDAKLVNRQGAQLAKLVRWFTPFEILKMATSTNGELLALSGLRNPYPKGKLGVIEEGAYADLIIIDGNPLTDIHLIENPDQKFLLIMKDGSIYKNKIK